MGKGIVYRNIIIVSVRLYMIAYYIIIVLSHDICIIVSIYRSCDMPHFTWLVILMYSILTNSVY